MARTATKRRLPAPTPEIAEQRCIDEAFALAEAQLKDGSASPSVITHFLKMGTERTKLEREKLARETELLQTKNFAIQNAEHTDALYAKAIEAMKRYSGQIDDEDDDY